MQDIRSWVSTYQIKDWKMNFCFWKENIFSLFIFFSFLFSESCIENFSKTFDRSWSSGGPKLFQYVYHGICQKDPNVCSDVTLTPSKYFFPVPWFQAVALFKKELPDRWDDLVKNSYAVHFYDSSVNRDSLKKIQKAKFFGKAKPALTYLAPKHCPLALNSH